MCGMSNSSVVPRVKKVNDGDAELLVTNISISSKIRITISMKLNLYGLVIAWIQVAPAKRTPSSLNVSVGKQL